MKRQKSIGVYIVTHNRLDTLITALESVINQSFKDFSIVVSDNSDNDVTKSAVEKYMIKDNRIHYLRQSDAPSSIDHINSVLRNNTFDYFVVFHDDDVMLPDMVGSLYNRIITDDSIAAVGSNAFKVRNGEIQNEKFMKESNDLVLQSSLDVCRCYINNSFPPFPSYMYNNKIIKGNLMNPSIGGKHSDVSFIASLADLGKLIWLSRPHMKYYFHLGQESNYLDSLQYLSLLDFYVKSGLPKKEIKKLRVHNIYNYYKNRYELNDYKYSLKRGFYLLNYSVEYGLKYFARYLKMLFD